MKKGLVLALALLLMIIVAGCSAGPSNIGILDMEKVLNDSERAQELQQELLTRGDQLQQDYDRIEEDLTGEEKETEQNKIYQEYLNSKQSLEVKLNQEINEILSRLSEEKDLDIVVYKNDVYYGGIDITDQVISRLDEAGDDNDGEG